jgi:hypothetical protein
MSILGILTQPSAPAVPAAPVAGYTAWFDASDTSTISLSGSDVTQWRDKSANAYHLAQSNVSLRPQSGTRTINSKNVIDYNSNTDTLVASTAANWTFLNNSTGSTMFMMLSVDAQPSGDPFCFLRTSGGGSNYNGYVGNVNTSNQWLHAVSASGVGNLVVNIATTLALTTNTGTIITVKSDPANATAANRSYIYKNSSLPNQNNTDTGTPSESAPTQPLRVGDYEEAGTLGINGVIGEIIFYNSKLSDGDISSNVTYLTNKWGI